MREWQSQSHVKWYCRYHVVIHQKYGRQRNFVGLHFWSRGYCVSTVGLDEAMVREYIRTQEEHEKKEEQIQLNY